MPEWPGLPYQDGSVRPSKAIVDDANTWGSDTVMSAGYFPVGLGPPDALRRDELIRQCRSSL